MEIQEYNLMRLPAFYNPPRISDRELLKIFPEAKEIIKEKEYEYNQELDSIQKSLLQKLIIINKTFKNDPWFHWFYTEWEQIKIKDRVNFLEKNLKRYDQLKYLMRNPERRKDTIEKEDIERAKQIPIEDFYEGNLRRSGNKLYGRCPFHGEKLGSFFIYINTNTFHCFGCGITGDVIAFIMKQQEITFIEAVKYLLKR